jgi:hypothetical protein
MFKRYVELPEGSDVYPCLSPLLNSSKKVGWLEHAGTFQLIMMIYSVPYTLEIPFRDLSFSLIAYTSKRQCLQ